MACKKLFLILITMVLGCVSSAAQTIVNKSDKITPRWIKSVSSIERYNSTYEFKLIEDEGPSLSSMKKGRLTHLGSYLQQTNKIDGVIDQNIELINNDEGSIQNTTHKFSFKTHTSVEQFECELIDDYWEEVEIGDYTMYRYYTLYAVSTPGEIADFDEFSTTTFYGARGLWRSAIVPGWGQFHKGSYLKGGLILGGTAALIGGVVATETIKTDYARRIGETHDADYKRLYAKRVDQFSTARNICLGALGALYVYNLIDAIAAPGARRVVVKEKGSSGSRYASYSFYPTSPDGMSVAMAFNLTF